MPAGVAGMKSGYPLQQFAQVEGVESVHVLGRIQRFDDDRFLNLRWQGKLDQDAVKAAIGIQAVNQIQEFRLGSCLIQVEYLAEHSRLVAGAALVADVNGRGRVAAHQHGGQARGYAVPLSHLGDAGGYFGPDFLAQGSSIQNLCHVMSPQHGEAEFRENSSTGETCPQRNRRRRRAIAFHRFP